MKIIILVLTTLIFNTSNLFAEITIHGKVTSSTKQPLEIADVWLRTSIGSGQYFQTQCDENGYYKITFPNDFQSFILGFSAANHLTATFQMIVSPNANYEINATINPYNFKNHSDTIFVIGNFNNFNVENGIIPMNKNDDGNYFAKIHSGSDTLAYQILIKTQDARRSINGQNATSYKLNTSYDNISRNINYDYISFVINETKNHNIVFDIRKFLTEHPAPQISSNPAINELQETGKIAENLYNEVKNSIRSRNEKPINYDSVKQIYSEKIDSMFRQSQYEETKINLALKYIDIIHYADTIPADISFVNFAIINFLLGVNANSNIWRGGNYFWACLIKGEHYDNNSKLENFLQANKEIPKDKNDVWHKNGSLYNVMINYIMKRGDTATAKKYFARMKAELPEHIYTQQLINRYDLDGSKRIKAGNIIPDFELANLDDADALISMQSLRGKFVLIDIWGTWCAPCVIDMPHLEAVYEHFKDRNFTIYGIAQDRAESVRNFRNNSEYKMPWLHSIINRAVLNLLEVTSYPTQILVSPSGEILTVVEGALGEELKPLLEKYLE